MGKIGDPAGGHLCLFFTGIVQELLKLMTADIAQDTAVFFPFKEPGGPSGRAKAVRTKSCHGDHLTDLPALRDVSRQDGTLIMQPFRVIHHILLPGILHGFPCGFQLFHGGKRRLIGEVVLSRVHGPQSQGTALTGHSGSGDHMSFRVFQGFFLAAGSLCLRKRFQECRHLFLIRIIDIFQCTARFCQAVAHAVDMAVVQPDRGEHKLSRLHNRLRLAFRRVGHSI